MAIMNSMQFRDIVSPILNDVFDGLYNKLPPEWSNVFTVERALPRRYQEDPVLYGLGNAVEKAEGQAITYDDGGEAYRARYNQKVYALAFALTEELMEDGEHISVGKVYTEHLARSMLETAEIVHANILNNAFDSAYPGGDGVSLSNSAHPLAQGGTFSNILATPANLSEAALEQLLTQINLAVDDRGKKIALNATQLVYPADLHWQATRLLQSVLRTGTANNDINAIKYDGAIPKMQMMRRLTSSKAYWIQTDAPRGLIHKTRRAITRAMEGDFNTGSMRYKSSERYAVGWTDPRCVFGSAGV